MPESTRPFIPMKSSSSLLRFRAAVAALLFSAAIPATLRAEEKTPAPAVPAPVHSATAAADRAPVDPKLKETLKLTDAQWSQVEAILNEKETRIRKESDRHFAAHRLIGSQTDAKLAELLTEEQMASYFTSARKWDADLGPHLAEVDADRLKSIQDEIRRRRDLRQQNKESSEMK